MNESGWTKKIAATAWNYLEASGIDSEQIADLLTRLYEIGWRGPEETAEVNPGGTSVLWKTGDRVVPVITGEGLIEFYKQKGHRFFVLRMEQLIRSNAGPNMAHLQSILANYEEECRSKGTDAVPDWLDYVFAVGGEKENSEIDIESLLSGLAEK